MPSLGNRINAVCLLWRGKKTALFCSVNCEARWEGDKPTFFFFFFLFAEPFSLPCRSPADILQSASTSLGRRLWSMHKVIYNMLVFLQRHLMVIVLKESRALRGTERTYTKFITTCLFNSVSSHYWVLAFFGTTVNKAFSLGNPMSAPPFSALIM